jgi:hypothetical protein
MEILPVNLTTIVEPSQHEDRKQQQRRPSQQQKRERITSVPVYTPTGGIEEEHPPNIDVLV